MKKIVRLIGAPGLYKNNWYKEGADHWSLNSLHTMTPDEDGFASWFQIHSEEMWRGGRNGQVNIEWMAREHDFPIYMQTIHSDVPASVRYPIEDAIALWPKRLVGPVFSDSFCYMVALAMIQGYKRIELVGLMMTSVIEAYTETYALGIWLGLAAARGIKIVDESGRLEPFSYGYEPRVPKYWMPLNVAESLIVDENLWARQERSKWQRSQYRENKKDESVA